MRRDYIESMSSVGFDEFLKASDALRNCKFVVAETKITALLKSIADNERLYSMFGFTLDGFDYRTAFTECIGNNVFSLPSDPKKAVALVFRILLDIDAGRMKLQNFLEAYFYSVSINESYARFCLEVLAPFENYCRKMFEHAQSVDYADRAAEMQAKQTASLKGDAASCIITLAEIAEATITGAIDRAEFISCLNGLERALRDGRADDIISSFLGVKYAVAYFFKSSGTVQDIYKKLESDIKRLSD